MDCGRVDEYVGMATGHCICIDKLTSSDLSLQCCTYHETTHLLEFMAESPGTIDEQRKRLEDALTKLRAEVLGLPKSLETRMESGPIAKYFRDFSYDEDEGPYFAVDQAWTCTFKGTDVEKKERFVLGGQFGVQMVYTFLAHFTKQPHAEEHNGLNAIYLHCSQIRELIRKCE